MIERELAMKYEINGYHVEELDLVKKDGTRVFLVDSWNYYDIAKPTIKEALEFTKERIQNDNDLTITGWTYDAEEGEFVGKLKRNKRGAIAIRAELRKVTKRKVTKKEADDAMS